MKVLVTGGAGYIGSHMVVALLAAGHDVVVLDDLSTGHRDAVAPRARLVEGSVARADDVRALLAGEQVEAVFHFAAKIRVDESVVDPRRYWEGNTAATLALLDAVLSSRGVRAFVQSSTAAVYGDPERVPIDEAHPRRPVNPYGASKLAIEHALEDYGRAYGLRWAALRYFNAAGADPEAGLVERHDPETHLVPIVLDVAAGRRPHVSLYGTSWPTPDGTCVRDYVHVVDLCRAHLAALDHLMAGGEGGAFNLGAGKGYSVREVVEAAKAVTGRDIPTRDAPPRAGDPPILVADVTRAAKVLGWRAERSDLARVVSDAWASRR